MKKNSGQSPPDCHSNPNRVRDHLANERTYLAWMRTAVALMGFGVLMVRISYLMPASVPGGGGGWQLGLLLALSGLFMALMANAHYFQVKRAIDHDSYEPESRWILLCTLCIVLIGTGVIYTLVISPTPPADSAGTNRPLE